MNNVIRDDMVPVYRVEVLPREIFLSAEEKGAGDAKSSVTGSVEFTESLRQVIEILQMVGRGTSVFTGVEIDGDRYINMGGSMLKVLAQNEKGCVAAEILGDFAACRRQGEPMARRPRHRPP